MHLVTSINLAVSSANEPELLKTGTTIEITFDGEFSYFFNCHTSSSTKRSINLALSHRGQSALKELGILDEVMTTAIPMPQRVIHHKDGTKSRQAYGCAGESLYSVGREALNVALLNYMSKQPNIEIHFEYGLKSLEPDGLVEFKCPTTATHIDVILSYAVEA